LKNSYWTLLGQRLGGGFPKGKSGCCCPKKGKRVLSSQEGQMSIMLFNSSQLGFSKGTIQLYFLIYICKLMCEYRCDKYTHLPYSTIISILESKLDRAEISFIYLFPSALQLSSQCLEHGGFPQNS
jgi:hypothetical protein